MAVDHLGNIVWICPVLPGTSADVKIWDTVITGDVHALCENAPYAPTRYCIRYPTDVHSELPPVHSN